MSYSLNVDCKGTLDVFSKLENLFNYIQQVMRITSPMLFRQVDDFFFKDCLYNMKCALNNPSQPDVAFLTSAIVAGVSLVVLGGKHDGDPSCFYSTGAGRGVL